MGVQYLSYQQIDKQKWDACIDDAHNGLVYAYTFYLDGMAKHWDALVLDDYEAVMPLPWNKKFGITYLYTPPFIQQLGIFSKTKVSDAIQHSFVTAARQRFRFAELFVNINCSAAQPNYILPLHNNYQLLRAGYKTTLLKSIKHAARFNIKYEEEFETDTAINLYQSNYASRVPHIKEQDYTNFIKVCEAAKFKNGLVIRKVTGDNGHIMAIVLLLKDNKRLYNIISAVTARGRQCEASYFLYDQLIAEFSEEGLTLDFEGSSIESIAGFYRKFGAVNEPYYFLRYNDLPWPVKLFK